MRFPSSSNRISACLILSLKTGIFRLSPKHSSTMSYQSSIKFSRYLSSLRISQEIALKFVIFQTPFVLVATTLSLVFWPSPLMIRRFMRHPPSMKIPETSRHRKLARQGLHWRDLRALMKLWVSRCNCGRLLSSSIRLCNYSWRCQGKRWHQQINHVLFLICRKRPI